MALDAGSAVAYLTLDHSKFTSGIKSAASEFSAFMDKTKTAGDRFNSLGSAATTMGNTLTKTITTSIVGVGSACTKMAVDFDSSFAKVSTLLDSNVVDFGKYKSQLLDASSQSATAVGDFSEAVYQSISAGVDQTKAIDFTTKAIGLAKGGFTDAASAVDVLTTCINAYSMSSEDATSISDKLIQTQNLGKTTVNELASSLGKVIPSAKNAGVNIDNVCAAMATLTKNGISTRISTTYFNAMLNELSKSGTIADKTLREMSGKGFKQLMDSGKGVTEILKMLQDKASESGKSLSDMFGSAEAGKAALTIMKNDGSEYNEMLKAMGNSAGTTQTALEKMADTPAAKLKKALNKMKNNAIKFGESLTPVVTKLAEFIGTLADKFNSLSDEQKEQIIKWAGIAAAVGPVLIMFGKTTQAITSICGAGKLLITGLTKIPTLFSGAATAAGVAGKAVGDLVTPGEMAAASMAEMGAGAGSLLSILGPLTLGIGAAGVAIYALKSAQDVMDQSITTCTEDMTGMQKVMADLMGVQRYSKEELEDMGVRYKEFAEGTSPETQQSLDDMAGKFRELQKTMDDVSIDGVITDEDVSKVSSRTDELCSNIINAINNHRDEGYQAMYNLFMQDGAIDDSEKAILDQLSVNQNEQIAEVQKGKEEINAIYAKAAEEHRNITEDEQNKINDIEKRGQEISLEALTMSNEEKERNAEAFYQRASSLDEAGMQEMLQTEIKGHDDSIQAIKDKYDTAIATMEEAIPKMSGKAKEEAEAKLQQYKDAEQQEIDDQNDLYNRKLELMDERQPEVLNKLNIYTGEELSTYDKESQDVLSTLQGHYDNMENITESGTQLMYNTVSGTWDAVTVKVDENSGKIIGIYDNATGQVGAYSQDIANSMKEVGEATDQATAESEGAMNSLAGCSVNASGEVVNSAGQIIGKLDDVTDSADGTRTGVMNLNGTPIRIKCDADGAISDLDDVNGKINKVHDKSFTITGIFKSIGEGISSAWSGIKSAFGYATGTDNAIGGMHEVAEHGSELIQSRKTGMMTLATSRQAMNLESGDKVYNAAETRKILNSMNTRNSNDGNNDKYNALIAKVEQLANILSEVLDSEGKVTMHGDAILDGEKIGEVTYETVSNKLAVASMLR